jgi:hypothetical protein
MILEAASAPRKGKAWMMLRRRSDKASILLAKTDEAGKAASALFEKNEWQEMGRKSCSVKKARRVLDASLDGGPAASVALFALRVAVLDLDQGLLEMCTSTVLLELMSVVVLVHHFLLVCRRLAVQAGAPVLSARALGTVIRAGDLLPTDAWMDPAKDKDILVSQNPNLIPDFAELVAKGRWGWNEGMKKFVEMSMGTVMTGMMLRVLEMVEVKSRVPLLRIIAAEMAAVIPSGIGLWLATDLVIIVQCLNWQGLLLFPTVLVTSGSG